MPEKVVVHTYSTVEQAVRAWRLMIGEGCIVSPVVSNMIEGTYFFDSVVESDDI